MECVSACFTVFFDEPFWVGVYERQFGGQTTVCRVVFGAEPKDYEVASALLARFSTLSFSPPVESDAPPPLPRNPKRLQREVARTVGGTGVGTRSQQALKLQQEAGKRARKVFSRKARDEAEERLRALRREQHKEKHKGH